MWDTIQKLRYRASAGISDAKSELDLRLSDRMELPLSGINGEQLYLTAFHRLLDRAAELDALYARLPARRGVRDIILLDAWSSATIEGARTTVAQVKASLTAPATKDDRMVVNSISGTNYALAHPITAQNLRKLWDKVVDGVCENLAQRGQLYRDGMVFIGSAERVIHTPADPALLPQLMSDWFAFLEQDTPPLLLRSFAAHFYFVYLHPFCDGNGRTARILNLSQLYHGGYAKVRSIAISSAINRQLSGYYAGLEAAEQIQISGQEQWLDLSPFVSYMLDIFEQSLIDAALSVNQLTEQERALLDRMNHTGPKAEITVRKASVILDLSESRTREILHSLVRKGYLQLDDTRPPYRYCLLQHMPY